MWQKGVAKAALVSVLAAVGYGSTWVRFETAAVHIRPLNAGADQRLPVIGSRTPIVLTDADLMESHARPLFSQNRRPFVAKPTVIEQPVAKMEQPALAQPANRPRRLLLIGTNVSGPAVSVLVLNRESEEIRWLEIGEAFDGWILADAGAYQARFTCREKQGNDCEYRLALYADAGGQ
jgi:hypothetical protein